MGEESARMKVEVEGVEGVEEWDRWLGNGLYENWGVASLVGPQ